MTQVRFWNFLLRLINRGWVQPGPPITPIVLDDPTGNALVREINRYRRGHGLRDLAELGCLEEQAREHSREMRRQRSLTHDGLVERLRACRKDRGSENVAYGYATAREVVWDGWRWSSDHRRNMLGEWTHVGAERSGTYWTAMFA